MTTIHAVALRPFAERARLFPESAAVVGLRFKYDPEAVRLIKVELAKHRDAIDPARLVNSPGGWLQREKAWFVELTVWPHVRAALEGAGFQIVEGHGR